MLTYVTNMAALTKHALSAHLRPGAFKSPVQAVSIQFYNMSRPQPERVN